MGSPACERRKSDHEEVQARERDHVHGELAEIRIQLAREAERHGDAGHDRRDELVEVAVRRVGQFQCAHADIVESLSC